jgi:hypothetical protein
MEGSMNFFLSLLLAFCLQQAASFEIGHSRRIQEQSHRPLTDKQKERIRVIAQQAREAVALLPRGEQKDRLAGQIAVLSAKSGDLAAAREIVNSITDDATRTSFIHQTVQAQAESGDVSGALQAAATIADESHRGEAIQAVASIQANAHDFQGAFQTAGQLRDAPRAYLHSIMAIAEAQIAASQKPEALKTLQNALEAASKSGVCEESTAMCHVALFSEIAKAQFRAGDPAAAEKTLKAARQGLAESPEGERFGGAIQLAQAEEETGHSDRANELLAALPGGFSQQWLQIGKVAEAAQKGDLTAAREAADSISNPQEKSFAQFAMAAGYAGSGDAKSALDALRTLKPLSFRAKYSGAVATALANKGKTEEAEEALKIGHAAAEVEEDEASLQELAVAAVQVCAEAGDADGARAKAELVKDTASLAEALHSAASTLAAKNQDGAVLKWASAQSSPLLKANLLLGAAEGIAEQKKENTAQQ